MKPYSSNSFGARFGALLLAAALLPAVAGCESLQRKLIRPRKTPVVRPAPVVNFQDYSQAMTPVERYRKHVLMFDYWSEQLLDELARSDANPKRFRNASAQSLEELQQLQALLQPARAAAVEPLLAERRSIDAQVQSGPYHPASLSALRMRAEAQKRRISREMDWRNVQDALKK